MCMELILVIFNDKLGAKTYNLTSERQTIWILLFNSRLSKFFFGVVIKEDPEKSNKVVHRLDLRILLLRRRVLRRLVHHLVLLLRRRSFVRRLVLRRRQPNL